MIYEKDLDESIAMYQGEANPSIDTCRKLAACLIVKWLMFGNPEQLPNLGQSYSFAAEPPSTIIYDSGTEFSRTINGRNPDRVWPIIDEMMSVVQALMPKLYDGVMRKLQE